MSAGGAETSPGPLPVSDEVWTEHVHDHPCDAGLELPAICPCDSVVLIACAACGEPLGLRLQPGHEQLCEHGLEILQLAKDPRPWAHWSTWLGGTAP